MTNLNGLILSGGKSIRMGQDKGMINYHGKPQCEYLVDLLKPFCKEVFISAKENKRKNTISDHFDLDSPLNGILSAFHFDPTVAWLTVPVDMPYLNSQAIEFLLRHRDPKKVATCFFDSDGKLPEPLLTIWEAKSKPLLFDFYNSSGFSPRKFLEENDVQLLQAPDAKILKNINTMEELGAFLKQSGETLQGGK
jgi:molybdopterin-guanine dinucleotide biosynthesis protein A